MILELNSNLKVVLPQRYRYMRQMEDIKNRTIKPENAGKWGRQDGRSIKLPGKEIVISSSIPETVSLSHVNYAEYLSQCYALHHSIIITPDIIWHAVMTEIAQEIIEDSKPYEHLFTTNPGQKTEIVVMTDAAENLPMDSLIQSLKEKIPSDVSSFFPEFTTTEPLSRLAFQAAFAEMCTPYYSYMTMMCGFPKIDVRGTVEDYQSILDRAYTLIGFFEPIKNNIPSYLLKVCNVMLSFINSLKTERVDFFNNILTTKNCGSGGEIELHGWWVQSMFRKSYAGEMPKNIPTTISRVPYKNLETNREFALNCGLFYSKEDADNFMVPQWSWVKNEIQSASSQT